MRGREELQEWGMWGFTEHPLLFLIEQGWRACSCRGEWGPAAQGGTG